MQDVMVAPPKDLAIRHRKYPLPLLVQDGFDLVRVGVSVRMTSLRGGLRIFLAFCA